MNCRICLSKVNLFSSAVILNKYKIDYFKCENCGFIQTEEPYWLEEAYSNAINDSDVGLVNRNIKLSKITRAFIICFFNKDVKFMDYGGGYGLFVRMMRDYGFNFYRYDKFCSNLFAKGFEADINTNDYELITAFELFEHFSSPISEIEQMLKCSNSILFSTELIPSNSPKPNDWWYYGLDHGQHISFYTRKSLSFIAKKFSLNLYTDGTSIHLLTDKKLSPFLFNKFTRYKIVTIFNMFFSQRSLIPLDYQKVTGKKLL